MRAAVALVVSLSVASTACFPHNKKARFYSQIGEGAALAGGIVLLSFTKTTADCEMENKFGGDKAGCNDRANLLGGLGLGLILVGLIGFITTVSTAEAEAKPAPIPPPAPAPAPAPAPPAPAPTPDPTPIATDPAGAGSDSGSGSAAPTPPPVPTPPPAPAP
jgi:hypothetical protein